MKIKEKIEQVYKKAFGTSPWVTALSIFIIFYVALLMSFFFTVLFRYIRYWGIPVQPTNFMQTYIFIIAEAASLIMISVGLTMTTRIRKFANFAHAEFIIVGIYTVIAMDKFLEIAGTFADVVFFKLIIAFLVSGAVGVLGELLVFGPLIRRNATPLSLMVASIGYGIIIRQTIQEIFTGTSKDIAVVYPDVFNAPFTDSLVNLPVIGIFFSLFLRKRTKIQFFSVDFLVAQDHVWALTIMVITIVVLRFIFNNTTLGMAMRATADDPDLAEISGINTYSVILWSWFIAGGVTGMGAIFLLESADINPFSGFARLLIIFAIVTLGGFDSFEGTLVSGFIIVIVKYMISIGNNQIATLGRSYDFIANMTFWSTSGDWSNAGPFAIIIAVLIFRPRGLFGLVDPKSKL